MPFVRKTYGLRRADADSFRPPGARTGSVAAHEGVLRPADTVVGPFARRLKRGPTFEAWDGDEPPFEGCFSVG